MIGSHLDTQPTGGKFDGVLGVLSGLEIVRRLNESGIRTRRPIEVVNWTNEEGCRFQPAMLGSAVFAGVLGADIALDARDADGARLADELAKNASDRQTDPRARRIAAYLELHIEQGPILEAEAADVGHVTGGQGMRWYDAVLRGFERHSGTTPMAMRRDALLAAARFIEAVHAIATAFGPPALATVGSMQVSPNSRNVIAGEVVLSVDLRHHDGNSLDAMDAALGEAFSAVLTNGIEGDLREVAVTPPIPFDEGLLQIIRRQTGKLGLSGRDIVSGAGHDACHIARIAPAAMIFTPCRGGISHNEAEHIEQQWAENGANVLLRTALEVADAP
jgi:N-carbamoyl-L-amino-acid hydrolase